MTDRTVSAGGGLTDVGTCLPSLGDVPDLLSEPTSLGGIGALGATDEENALKSQLMDDIFGDSVPSDAAASGVTSAGRGAGDGVALENYAEEEADADGIGGKQPVAPTVLESVGLSLEDALTDLDDLEGDPAGSAVSDGHGSELDEDNILQDDGGSDDGADRPVNEDLLLENGASLSGDEGNLPETDDLPENNGDSVLDDEERAPDRDETSLGEPSEPTPQITTGDNDEYVPEQDYAADKDRPPHAEVPAADSGQPATAPENEISVLEKELQDGSPQAAITISIASICGGADAQSLSNEPSACRPAAAADDDDDIVVLDEVIVPPSARPYKRPGGSLPGPPRKRRSAMLGPLCKRRPMLAPPEVVEVPKGKLRGPACRRPDKDQLGPPSSRMPRPDGEESESEDEVSPEEQKKHDEACRLAAQLTVSLRLNNTCTKSSMTARQWERKLQQGRDARKKYWEDFRAGRLAVRHPPPSQLQSKRSRPHKGAAKSSPVPVRLPACDLSNFAATKQLMSLINSGTLQMTSVGVRGAAPHPQRPGMPHPQRPGMPHPQRPGMPHLQRPGMPHPQRPSMPHRSNGVPGAAPRPAAGPPGRRPAPMVTIPKSAGMAAATGPARTGVVMAKAAGNVPSLDGIPDLGDKQRHQLLKLLKGNNGTSISPADNTATQKPAAPATKSAKAKAEEERRGVLIPPYCSTTSGKPTDLFSVYLSAKQDPIKCFVNMQIDNHCLKLRLPARPKTCGMVFAQVTRAAMEPECIIHEGSNIFVPPGPDKSKAVLLPSGRTQPPQQQRAPAARPGQSAQPAPPTPQPPAHKCSKCSQKFVSAQLLNNHFRVYHAGPSLAPPGATGINAVPYDCPLCKKWSGLLNLMRHHIAVVHNSQTTQGFYCHICRKIIGRSKFAWITHVIQHAVPSGNRGVPMVINKPSAAAPLPLTVPLRRPAPPAPLRRTIPPAPLRKPMPPAPLRKPMPPMPIPQQVLRPSLGHRHSKRAAAAVARKRSAAAVNGAFPCPNCDAVFSDVSQFPEHWIQAHAHDSADSPSKPLRRPNPPAAQPKSEARFSGGSPAPTPASASASASVPPAAVGKAGSSVIRCSRCGKMFGGETDYAQHWISMHTRIRLSADQQAAAQKAALAGPAPSATVAPRQVKAETITVKTERSIRVEKEVVGTKPVSEIKVKPEVKSEPDNAGDAKVGGEKLADEPAAEIKELTAEFSSDIKVEETEMVSVPADSGEVEMLDAGPAPGKAIHSHGGAVDKSELEAHKLRPANMKLSEDSLESLLKFVQ